MISNNSKIWTHKKVMNLKVAIVGNLAVFNSIVNVIKREFTVQSPAIVLIA